MKAFLIHILLLFIAALPLCAEELNISQLIQTGQTKEEVKGILHDPYEIRIFEKPGGPIWGPEEEFWDKIPDGTKLEVWRYRSEAGNLNLYFLGDDDHLTYKAFAPKGVVYEPSR